MQLLDFIEGINLPSKTETEKAGLLAFYYYKETGEETFSMAKIVELFEDCGFNKPNPSRLKDKVIKGKAKVFLVSKGEKGKMTFIPAVLQGIEKEYGALWKDTVTISSDSELLEEVKFCGKRPFLDNLIKQINFTYANNCYDACAVLMRRLFEVLLVLSYQNKGIENDIINAQGNYLMLEGIVKDAVQNKTLAIPPRHSKHFEAFREVGNNSAHSVYYTAGRKDIDDIKINYRVMMEDLYNRAGLM